jgi:hypothetical protein
LSTNCENYPNFSIEYCSSESKGTLQYSNSGVWQKLWTVTGVRDASQCADAETPYLTKLAGTLQTKQAISLRMIFSNTNGKVPTPDYFKVKVS